MSKQKARRPQVWTGFINCEVGKGMFQGEKIVSLKVMGQDVSAIVNEKSVKDDKLQVNIYEAKQGRVLIGLPGESFSTSRKVWIDSREISQ